MVNSLFHNSLSSLYQTLHILWINFAPGSFSEILSFLQNPLTAGSPAAAITYLHISIGQSLSQHLFGVNIKATANDLRAYDINHALL